MRALLLSLLLAVSPALAADPTEPHPHQGLARAWSGAPPRVTLTAEQEEKLARGEPVLVQAAKGSGGNGVAVQDVAATPAQVWARITDFAAYPRMVPHVERCVPYARSGDRVDVEFELSVMGTTWVYYIAHRVHTAEGWVTWTLDYSRRSDLADSVGYWRVDPHPTQPGWSRVSYAVDVRLEGWVPGFVQDMLGRRGLLDATRWVKREAEAAP